jgi:hypothetical protein
MQYNGHATNQDLVTLSNKLSKQNDVSFPLVEKTLYANMGEREIMSAIHEVYGGWKYDDKNQTDLPEATADLVSGQDTYTLPVDASFVDGVYYQNENNSTWNKVLPLAKEQLNNEQDFMTTDGPPAYYRPVGDTIKLYPASNFSKDDALKVQYSRDIVGFTTASTTTTPAFDSQFHEAVAVYMAYMVSAANSLKSEKMLTVKWEKALEMIRRHYQMKFKEMFPTRIKVNTATPIEEYL